MQPCYLGSLSFLCNFAKFTKLATCSFIFKQRPHQICISRKHFVKHGGMPRILIQYFSQPNIISSLKHPCCTIALTYHIIYIDSKNWGPRSNTPVLVTSPKSTYNHDWSKMT